MSILLNALNKGTDDQSSDDIDELIASPLEETPERSSQGTRFNVLHGLLLAIALILVVICYLLFKLLSESESARSTVVNVPSSSTQSNLETSSINSNLDNKTNVTNTASTQLMKEVNETSQSESVGNEQETVVLNPSTSNDKRTNVERGTASSDESEQYIESYRPKRYASENTSSQTRSDTIESSSNSRTYSTEVENRNTPPSREYTSNLRQDLPVREKDELTQVQLLMVNEVVIDAHIYSEDPSQRFVFVGGEMKTEGDQIVNSWFLESIEPKGVIINNGVLRVRLNQ
ncbi:general secretion pathway protein GspB [Pleionea litopenaei]|uniref:General secretion pathway protein GspB n=1 Tax=Pleionea litopenaei TaxID=3070815 RepID=A0AA51X5B8_9GAMM|nr:general secretion pathway protein GspB [Pleionea sp. HL-JVS1]WMS85569.1 general secretion pathway protein GspB [Pleionea sp. HL-JVS1]